jgi:hypothetical protein
LAKASFGDFAIFRWGVTPEEQVFKLLTVLAAFNEVF